MYFDQKKIFAIAMLLLLSACGGLEWNGSSLFGSNKSSSAPKNVAAPAAASNNYAVAGYNETLSQIAARYGVNANALAAENNLSINTPLSQGQYLRLPAVGASAAPAVVSKAQETVRDLPTVKEQANQASAQVEQTIKEPVSAIQKKGYIWPVKGKATSSSNGLNIAAPRSAPVVAAQAGTVIHSGNVSGYGNTIIVRHNDGLVSVYGYNDTLVVKKGDKVNRGQVIARVGSSGSATTPSLRFELRKGKTPVNPYDYLGK